jgi:hypothetical protein
MHDIKNFNSELTRKIFKKNAVYHQRDCYGLCYQRDLIKKCGCYDLTALSLQTEDDNQTLKPCLSFEQVKCNFEHFQNFFKERIEAICVNECPMECEHIKYSLTKSLATYPNKGYFQYLKTKDIILRNYGNDSSKITFEDLKSRLLSINVYYDELGYTKLVEYEKLKFFDLISSIGGTFGECSFFKLYNIFFKKILNFY